MSELHQDLEKYNNQARFVQMIVNGKLVVSKKPKLVLVQELKDNGFKAIPKVAEPLKQGELEPVADDDEEEEDQGSVEAADYDYLLGMPIWSLTKERVEKLLKQVGDVEQAIDALIKLSKEDLWKRDLDEFLEEWHFQLEDERKSQKKVANMGRRASTKLKIGGVTGRKRKGNGNGTDDSDFADGPKVKKVAAPKAKGGILGEYFSTGAAKAIGSQKTKAPSAAAKNAQKLLGMLDADVKPASQEPTEDDIWLQADGPISRPLEHTTQKAQAEMKKPVPKLAGKTAGVKKLTTDDKRADEEIVRPTVGRKPRAVAVKPVKYANISDSDSDGDDMLFNVGNMVKGISTDTTNVDASRPLFSATQSRPGSSSGLAKPPSSHKQNADLDADETDYSKLAPPTTKKGPAVTARQTIISDEDDSLEELPIQKPQKSKLAPKVAAKPRILAKKPDAAASSSTQPKQMPLSPAAKAYAAKKAKAEKAAQEAEKKNLDVDTVANEILDDDEDEVQVRRPARRAAAVAPKKKWVLSDDESDEDEETADFEGDDSDD